MPSAPQVQIPVPGFFYSVSGLFQELGSCGQVTGAALAGAGMEDMEQNGNGTSQSEETGF